MLNGFRRRLKFRQWHTASCKVKDREKVEKMKNVIVQSSEMCWYTTFTAIALFKFIYLKKKQLLLLYFSVH